MSSQMQKVITKDMVISCSLCKLNLMQEKILNFQHRKFMLAIGRSMVTVKNS